MLTSGFGLGGGAAGYTSSGDVCSSVSGKFTPELAGAFTAGGFAGGGVGVFAGIGFAGGAFAAGTCAWAFFFAQPP